MMIGDIINWVGGLVCNLVNQILWSRCDTLKVSWSYHVSHLRNQEVALKCPTIGLQSLDMSKKQSVAQVQQLEVCLWLENASKKTLFSGPKFYLSSSCSFGVIKKMLLMMRRCISPCAPLFNHLLIGPSRHLLNHLINPTRLVQGTRSVLYRRSPNTFTRFYQSFAKTST